MMYKYSHFVGLFVWLLLLCFNCCADRAGNIQCIVKERDALLQFKHDIDVDHCGLLNSWVGQECCQWHGIRCSNHSGHVISLDVSGTPYDDDSGPATFCIKGTVSPSLVELKHLEYMDLSYNNFRQPIPSFIGSLLSLKHLILSQANFFGEIPHRLANLSSLTSLDLSHNRDLGIKSLRWLSYLTLLTDINLSNLYLSLDWMQIVSNLPSLKNLYMDRCGFFRHTPLSLLEYTNSSTTLDTLSLQENYAADTRVLEWVSNFTRLSSTFSYLDLSDNGFLGHIPSSLGNMHSLLYLYLSYNRFECPIPETISNLENLVYLDLSWNAFECIIPETISNLKHLVYLDLMGNRFQGYKRKPEVLESWCSLQMLSLGHNNIASEFSTIIRPLSQCVNKSLVSLDIRQNSVWGSLPNEIYTFSSLRKLDLSVNKLTGTVSPFLSQLSMLEKLDLSYNFLKGIISHHHLSSLSRLTFLDLNQNSELVINISANWVPPFQLDVIHLKSCKMGPYFPKWLLTQTNFSELDISNASISDAIPTLFSSLLTSNLKLLNMSKNMIRGNIPDVPISLHNSLYIDLSSNLFHGAIPSFLRNTSALHLNDNNFSDCASIFHPGTKLILYTLSLSNNKLSGELPSSWGYFDQLTSIYLDGNNFSGSLHNSIGMLTKLEALHLHQNNISGKLPIALQKCTSLIMLDLSHNSLTGALPIWFGNGFYELAYVSLRSNDFRGGLPLSLCEMYNLQILDISSNRLAGSIPKCIYNFTAMLDSSESTLSLFDSAWIMWKRVELTINRHLGLVKAIDMSNNELEGPIPDEISSLVGLQSLDLSRNRLNESITPNIGLLTHLEYLNLSRNQLWGEIPSSLSAVSFLGTLDVSYNNLSGQIPLGTQLQGFNVSSYIGNPRLCGEPLPKCRGSTTPPNSPKEDKSSHDDDNLFPGFYISVILGFIVGFWGVCGTLVIKRSWRHTFFQFFDDIKERLHAFVIVNVARILRRST